MAEMTPSEKLRAAERLLEYAASDELVVFYSEAEAEEIRRELRDLAAKLEAEARG